MRNELAVLGFSWYKKNKGHEIRLDNLTEPKDGKTFCVEDKEPVLYKERKIRLASDLSIAQEGWRQW